MEERKRKEMERNGAVYLLSLLPLVASLRDELFAF